MQKVFVSAFYGEFSLYDVAGRLMAKSSSSKCSFLKADLQTECAQIWYDATKIQHEHEILRQNYKVIDPGLYFNFGNVFIEFHDAPDWDNQRVYAHIPIFFNITNVWQPTKKEVLFRV